MALNATLPTAKLEIVIFLSLKLSWKKLNLEMEILLGLKLRSVRLISKMGIGFSILARLKSLMPLILKSIKRLFGVLILQWLKNDTHQHSIYHQSYWNKKHWHKSKDHWSYFLASSPFYLSFFSFFSPFSFFLPFFFSPEPLKDSYSKLSSSSS